MTRRRHKNGRRLHRCCICGHFDVWGKGWTWYGSFNDLDNAVPVAKLCSKLCLDRFKALGGQEKAEAMEEAHEFERMEFV